MCLKSGVNPYRVYACEVEHPRYRSKFATTNLTNPDGLPKKFVTAYTPWGYTFVLPFTLIPFDCAYVVFSLFTAMFFVLAWMWSKNLAMKKFGEKKFARKIAWICVSFYALAAYLQMINQNYAAFNLIAVIGMIWCLDKENSHGTQRPRARFFLQICAGFCWAILMIKPQIGLLAFLPLLFSKKRITMISAAVFCLAGTVPPMLLSGDSFFSLITDYFANGADHYKGSLLMPNFYTDILGLGGMSAKTRILISMSLGGVVCAMLSWRVRHCRDWAVKLTPWLAIAPAWTYSFCHDATVWLIPVTVWLLDSIKPDKSISRSKTTGYVFFICGTWFWAIHTITDNLAILTEKLSRLSSSANEWSAYSYKKLEDINTLFDYIKGLGLYPVLIILFSVWLWKFADKNREKAENDNGTFLSYS